MSLSYIDQACSIYCEGRVLQAVQLAQIYNDSKTFVDMPMKYDPNVTLAAFNNITDPSNKQQLENYLNEYFLPAGSDLNDWVPTDFNNQPAFLDSITDKNYQSWASDINQLWLTLGREVNLSVHENPQRHSFLPRNYPMIVPGGRFRESYYWDSWWIVRGLLVCDMNSTALNVINNLLDDVNTFGFVPNGGRIYYLDRSQPPLLSEMVVSYKDYMIEKYGETDSIKTFLTNAYATLLLEYSFWMNESLGHCVTMPTTSTGSSPPTYKLNRYYSNYTTPRPESYLQDYDNAHASTQGLAGYYQQVRAGAETGWDFSSRWISASSGSSSGGSYNITNIHTNEVVPIDLNSIMYRFELNLASLATTLASWEQEDTITTTAGTATTSTADSYITQAETFTQAATNRSAAINSYLWDAGGKHWRDYNLTSLQWTHNSETLQQVSMQSRRNNGGIRTTTATTAGTGTTTVLDTVSYASVAYWVPMWAGLLPADGSSADDIVASLQTSGILQPGGVLTSTVNTGQQWDAPNAWPPEVLLTIEGLQKLNTPNSNSLASELSQQWLNTGYIAYNNTGYMYEKYNAYEIGVGGGGGEYIPQIGFGWTNGVALVLLRQAYSTPINSNGGGNSSVSDAMIIVVSCLAGFIGVLSIVMLYLHVYFPVQHSSSSTSAIAVVTPLSQKQLSPVVSEGGVTMRPLSPELDSSSKHSNSVLDV